MDYRSVNKEKDLIASDVIYPHYVGESFNVFHNREHRWYYLSDQLPDEVFIFKSYDSKSSVSCCECFLGSRKTKHRNNMSQFALMLHLTYAKAMRDL
ncbi:hypothetical protein BDV96DRAFT_569812 [Lophiotrema nucula]|uniref:Uncharacterized protein n=1 Tax=Lophiotrema nucula TaxID=690887 RepID=A0A6A5ZHV0_9PLEO|nr:hypothetical protein BDV96DRAFT_569812 [Lophiotrema nucula]